MRPFVGGGYGLDSNQLDLDPSTGVPRRFRDKSGGDASKEAHRQRMLKVAAAVVPAGKH